MSKTYKFKPEIGDILDNEFTMYLREVTRVINDDVEYQTIEKGTKVKPNVYHLSSIDTFYDGSYTITRSKSYLINKFIEICGNTYTQK